MKRGLNTNNTLQELELIRSQMKKGGFDFDGRNAKTALDEVEEDIFMIIEDDEFYECPYCIYKISAKEASEAYDDRCPQCRHRIEWEDHLTTEEIEEMEQTAKDERDEWKLRAKSIGSWANSFK